MMAWSRKIQHILRNLMMLKGFPNYWIKIQVYISVVLATALVMFNSILAARLQAAFIFKLRDKCFQDFV